MRNDLKILRELDKGSIEIKALQIRTGATRDDIADLERRGLVMQMSFGSYPRSDRVAIRPSGQRVLESAK